MKAFILALAIILSFPACTRREKEGGSHGKMHHKPIKIVDGNHKSMKVVESADNGTIIPATPPRPAKAHAPRHVQVYSARVTESGDKVTVERLPEKTSKKTKKKVHSVTKTQ